MQNHLTKGILVIEDDLSSRLLIKRLLLNDKYEKVYEASGVNESLSILSERGEDIYIVLLDIQLPDGNGINVMEHLANIHDYIVGIIVTTGFVDQKIEEEFFSLGTDKIIAVDFVSKPIEAEPLLKQIERTIKLIERKRNQQVIIFQNKTVDSLETIENNLKVIKNKLSALDELNGIGKRLDKLEKKSSSFLKDLGLELIRLIIIGLAVIAFLYLGFDDVIKRIIQYVK